jgi:hypothetical protein
MTRLPPGKAQSRLIEAMEGGSRNKFRYQMKIKLFPLGGWLCQPVGRDSRGWKYSFLS